MSETGEQPARQAGPSTAGTLVFLAVGPLIWALHLSILYGGHTLICRYRIAPPAADLLVLVATAAATSAILAFLVLPGWSADLLGVRRHAEGRPAYVGMAWILAVLAGVAILWAGLAALMVNSCTLGR